jgi:hypothetical protein
MYRSRHMQGAQYYCRGCGGRLPPDGQAQFHPECLKADKRLRTREKRQLEQERLLAWLERQRCPACGSAIRLEPKRRRREASPAIPDSPGVRGAA